MAAKGPKKGRYEHTELGGYLTMAHRAMSDAQSESYMVFAYLGDENLHSREVIGQLEIAKGYIEKSLAYLREKGK